MQNIISLVQILAHGGEMSWAESCFDLCIPLQVTAVILRQDFFFLREIYLSVGLLSLQFTAKVSPFDSSRVCT